MKLYFFVLFLVLIIFAGSSFSYFILRLYGLFKGNFSNNLAIILFTIFPIIFIVSKIIGNISYSKINGFLHTVSSVWMGMLLYLFISSILLSVLYFFIKNTPTQIQHIIGYGFLLCTVIVTLYGIYNASHPRVVTVEVKNQKLAQYWKNKKIVLFSDTHLGLTQGRHFTEKIVDLINTQNPDIVFIAGDVIDGPRIPYQEFIEPLNKINSSLGVFYTTGNHEWYNNEPYVFLDTIKKYTTSIIDEKQTVNNTDIIGINYRSEDKEAAAKRFEKIKDDSENPSIVLLHDPKNTSALIEKGASLVLSGHTHCGQVWPGNYLVNMIYKNLSYGLTVYNSNQSSLTSCGVGTAVVPMRVGNRPEIVVIQITE